MKALSIRQPWAWLIVNGHKDIENRTWATKFRGQFLIHAAKGMTRQEYEDVADYVRELNRINLMSGTGKPAIVLPEPAQLLRGGFLGTVTLVDCVPPTRRRSLWHMPGCQGFHLADVKPMTFVECKGALGFFNVPGDVLAQLLATAGEEAAV